MLLKQKSRKQLLVRVLVNEPSATMCSLRFYKNEFFCMNLNTYLKRCSKVSLFTSCCSIMNQAVRAAGNQWQDSFQRSLIYTVCFYSQEALCGDGECYKTRGGGQVPGMHPGNFVRSRVSHLWGASHWLTGVFFTCLYREKQRWDVGEMMGDRPDGPQKSLSNHTRSILNSPDSCFLSTGNPLRAIKPRWLGGSKPDDVNIRWLTIKINRHTFKHSSDFQQGLLHLDLHSLTGNTADRAPQTSLIRSEILKLKKNNNLKVGENRCECLSLNWNECDKYQLIDDGYAV